MWLFLLAAIYVRNVQGIDKLYDGQFLQLNQCGLDYRISIHTFQRFDYRKNSTSIRLLLPFYPYFDILIMDQYNYLITQQMLEDKQRVDVSNTVVMIRPFNFRSNQMTISSNYYQQQGKAVEEKAIHLKSLQEFDRFHLILVNAGVKVVVVQDQGKNNTPDSVFPNNWVSFHQGGQYILYPMFAANRRLERQINIFEALKQNQIETRLIHDYSSYEHQDLFLEGTGSMVLDRKSKVAYAALSPRTHQKPFIVFCQQNGYKPCFFKAYQTVNSKRQLIYHTNVMMWVGDGIVFICLDSIDDQMQKKAVIREITQSKQEIVELSQEQINNFAGNCLMLGQSKGEKVVIMSQKAYNAYNKQQIDKIRSFAKIVYCDLDTIERYGGGSARCMLAEIF